MNDQTQTAEQVSFERRMRAAVRQQVVAMGVPTAAAAEIVDLAFHATDKALDALAAATGVGSTAMIRANALLIATSLVDIRLKQARDMADELSKQDGCKMMRGMVRVGGQSS